MDVPRGPIRTVLFDADGVLQRPARSLRAALAGICRDPDHVEGFLSDIFEAEAACVTGRTEFAPLLAGVLERWKSDAPVSAALRALTLIEPDDAILALVQLVRSTGVRVGLATNQQPHRARYMLRELGYSEAFDHHFCSCHVGHAKPSATYFGEILRRLDSPPHAVLFVDDHEENVAGAREVGMCAETFELGAGPTGMRRLLHAYGVTV